MFPSAWNDVWPWFSAAQTSQLEVRVSQPRIAVGRKPRYIVSMFTFGCPLSVVSCETSNRLGFLSWVRTGVSFSNGFLRRTLHAAYNVAMFKKCLENQLAPQEAKAEHSGALRHRERSRLPFSSRIPLIRAKSQDLLSLTTLHLCFIASVNLGATVLCTPLNCANSPLLLHWPAQLNDSKPSASLFLLLSSFLPFSDL